METNNQYCNGDLMKERQKCSFVKEEITNILDGGKDMTELRRKVQAILFADPKLKDPIPPDYLSHEERYSNELRKICALVLKFREGELQSLVSQVQGIRMIMGAGVGAAIMVDGNPFGVHYVMFLPAIMGHGTVEQQGYWMARAWNGEIIGTYAQTEMGHGTFLRGLETTATYDPKNEEFVINSPTITATKWWPGGLGKTANYCIVMAQLYTEGECKGVHPFIVQLRDEKTHESFPGVILGEIGPRIGMHTNDNGFLRFNHYRIPRTQMLMKNAQVLKDGTYIRPASSKLAYGTMMFVRVTICMDMCKVLQKAVAIATRYSAVRHQSEIVPGEPEPQILDFQCQQYKLLPQIATLFALHFSADYLWHSYHEVNSSIQTGNLDMLPQMHSLACGLKAYSTQVSTRGVDICRLACGGHGYLASSNLPRLYTHATAAITYEGENTVMWLQMARYLVKMKKNGQQTINVAKDLDLSNEGLVNKLQYSSQFLLTIVVERIQKLIDGGMKSEHAWNQCSVGLAQCSESEMRHFTCDRFLIALNDLNVSPPTKKVLQKLCRLYIIYVVVNCQGDLLRCGALTPPCINTLEEELSFLLGDLRQEAVAIVDSFDIHDRVLNSVLGSWDGDVYNRMYETALLSPLNQKDVPDAYHKHLKPFFNAKL